MKVVNIKRARSCFASNTYTAENKNKHWSRRLKQYQDHIEVNHTVLCIAGITTSSLQTHSKII